MEESINVVILPEVAEYLDELGQVLYSKGYFGFLESAKAYIDKLVDDIHLNINKRPKKITPSQFKRRGSHYVIYKPNKRTTWYIFFNFKDDRYLIRYITNNHVSAQHIKDLE